MKLDLKGIHEYQQNRHPYLFIDYVDEVIPGKIANGFKDLKDDWFFKVHWPTDPNVPGMLQIEAMVQMAALTILTLPNNKGKLFIWLLLTKLHLKEKLFLEIDYILKLNLNHGIEGLESVKELEQLMIN